MENYQEVFVTIYKVDRLFGGREEGGWWYNDYSPIASFKVRTMDAEKVKRLLEKTYPYEQKELNSVNGMGTYDICIETVQYENETIGKPIYE